ncbi:MAG: discoidin domain-containing protein [Nanoarchaeota archaeon]|nr:discoidin domain-containing protein [Nanoarchaeota archaeon]
MKLPFILSFCLLLMSSSALGAYVIASQTSAVQCIAYSGSGVCEGAFDGDFTSSDAYSTSWYCNAPECSAGDRWAKVDLGTSYCIKQVMITAPADGGGTDYLRMLNATRLQYSSDNTSFTTVPGNFFYTTRPTGPNFNSTATFASNSIDARYWRVVSNSTHNTGGNLPLGTAEISLYYDDSNPNCVIASAPIVSAINCTSCNTPSGDTSEPYSTSDTTPTFKFNTDVNAHCRIGPSNINWTTMGSAKNCTSGGGAQNHTCTLITDDEVSTSSPTLYISCSDNVGTETISNSSAKLPMDITSLSSTISDALDQGIQTSLVWPGATIYNNQQVYLRNLANTQIVGTADRVVVSGSQRWIFNVGTDSEAPVGLFNITPAVYSLELFNVSSSNIQSKISALINATKR